MGRLKIPYQDLFLLSKGERKALIEGHEIDIKENINILRELATGIISPHVGKNDRHKLQGKKLWPMPWDEKPKEEDPAVKDAKISKVKKLAEIYRSGKIKPKKNG